MQASDSPAANQKLIQKDHDAGSGHSNQQTLNRETSESYSQQIATQEATNQCTDNAQCHCCQNAATLVARIDRLRDSACQHANYNPRKNTH